MPEEKESLTQLPVADEGGVESSVICFSSEKETITYMGRFSKEMLRNLQHIFSMKEDVCDPSQKERVEEI